MKPEEDYRTCFHCLHISMDYEKDQLVCDHGCWEPVQIKLCWLKTLQELVNRAKYCGELFKLRGEFKREL